MSNAALCAILQAPVSASCDTHAGEQRMPETSQHNKTTLSTFQAHKHQRYPPTVHTHTHAGEHASQKPADTTKRSRQLFKHNNTCKHVALKSLFSLYGPSGKMPGWPQGECTAPPPTNGATQHAQLPCWVEEGSAIHTACCVTNHDASTQPGNPQG